MHDLGIAPAGLAGGSPAASHFLLLVQKKVTKEKDTRMSRPNGFLALLVYLGIGRQHFRVLTSNVRHPCLTPSGYSQINCATQCDKRGIKPKQFIGYLLFYPDNVPVQHNQEDTIHNFGKQHIIKYCVPDS